ncbi:3-ketodihydrosphingosine reductase-like [Acanthaster planci]|uniref:3-dehydrosphinganine reductase n=1 Tax=Acanthaster planci TaxID=133434 RepID=A0A8B7ZEW2_ACAPL|nr:3-ketodihydrosphingosine reductase-like [Acanthaster planci]
MYMYILRIFDVSQLKTTMFQYLVISIIIVFIVTFVWLSSSIKPKLLDLKQAHVVITGGSSGIGKAVAAEVLKQGANVTILARNQTRLQKAKEDLQQYIKDKDNQKILCISVDVSHEYAAVEDAVRKSAEELGPCDILVNSAGMSRAVSFEDTNINDFKRVMDANFLGSVYPTRAVLPYMKERRRGRIVFISSQAGQLGVYGYTAYGSSKFAVRGLAETLQMEVKPYNIYITINFPPDTDTPMLAEDKINMPKETILVSETSGLHQPEEIAKIVVKDAKHGRFQSYVGLDGFFLATVTCGMSPVTSLLDALLQVSLMSLLKAISFVFIANFNSIVMKCYKEREGQKQK